MDMVPCKDAIMGLVVEKGGSYIRLIIGGTGESSKNIAKPLEDQCKHPMRTVISWDLWQMT